MKGLEQLEATAGLVRALVAQLTEEEAAWKPAADRFSVKEAVAHLAEAEEDCHVPRFRQWGREEKPRFSNCPDGTLPARIGTVAEELERFERARREVLEWLRQQPESALGRKGVHEFAGEVTIENQVAACATHDLGHVRQIAELVRAVKFHPKLGPWKAEFHINP